MQPKCTYQRSTHFTSQNILVTFINNFHYIRHKLYYKPTLFEIQELYMVRLSTPPMVVGRMSYDAFLKRLRITVANCMHEELYPMRLYWKPVGKPRSSPATTAPVCTLETPNTQALAVNAHTTLFIPFKYFLTYLTGVVTTAPKQFFRHAQDRHRPQNQRAAPGFDPVLVIPIRYLMGISTTRYRLSYSAPF